MVDKIRTQEEIVTMLRRAGLGPRPAKIGSAIALCEAPARGTATPSADFGLVGDLDLVDETWGPSYGGFQIRSLNAQQGTGTYRDGDQLIKPKFNAKSAVQIYLNSGWSAWSTYTSGMYKAYLQDMYPPPEGIYVVLADDTLSTIALKLGISWQELARLNNLHEPYTIYIGQYLRYLPE